MVQHRSATPTPYDTHELHALASKAIMQSYAVLAAALPFQFLAEVGLRRYAGFADDTVADAALRYLVPAALALVAYVLGRYVDLGRRMPFLQGYVVMVCVVSILARAACHAGGAVGPYSASIITLLFCWSLIMPGGARHAAFPILTAPAVFYGIIFLSRGAVDFDVRGVAFALFTVTSAVFALVYAEVLERWRRKVSTASTTDSLTALLNRAYLLQRFDDLHTEARARPRPVSVLMVDVDHFKRVNDTYGHATGDEVLRRVAAMLASATRLADACGRLGGEEFVLVLDGCDERRACEVAERIRASISAIEFGAQDARFHVSVSIGVSALTETGFATPEAALKAADAALYASKSAGRDRVTVFRFGEAQGV